MPRRVLIAWEFGAGLGHYAWINTVTRSLRARGCEPFVAVPDPDRARALFGAEAPRFIPVVPFPMRHRSRGLPESFADILLQRGFSDTAALADSVRGWQAIYREHRIETVLPDYAHVAQLAAWLMDLPMVTWGMPFANPPVPIPCFRPGVPPSERAAKLAESRLLECINAVAKAFGRPPLETLAAWLHAPYRFTSGIPETNVYDFEPEGGYLGAQGRIPQAQTFEWRPSGRTRVLCYLRWDRETPRLIAALKRPDRDVACVIPGAPQEWLAGADGIGLHATNLSVDLSALIAQADIVVSNGSGGITCAALIAGKPQFLDPFDWEKTLIARKLEKLEVASIRGPAPKRLTRIDPLTKADFDKTGARAREIAAAQSESTWAASLEALINTAVTGRRPGARPSPA